LAFRVLRLAAVASILAFGLTARSITPTYAHAAHKAAAASAALVVPPGDLGEPPSTEPSPTDSPPPSDPPPSDPPPVDPAPVASEPPAATVGPTATDPPSTDPAIASAPTPAASDAPPPTESPVPAPTATPVVEPSPTIADPALANPDADDLPVVDAPTTDPADVDTPAPAASDAPSTGDPAGPPSTDTVVPVPAPAIVDLAPSDPAAAEPVPQLPSTHPLPAAISTVSTHGVASAQGPTGSGQSVRATATASVPSAPGQVDAARSVVPVEMPRMTNLTLADQLEPVAAGIVAGLAVTNRAPASVAVAIEFGRAGGGWAGAIVFNLWLGRQMRMRRMSQRQLAALSGVDHSTISRLLLHDRRPSLATATKLARAFRQVEGETDTADYFERVPEETIFPSRRVEMALRADELLDDAEVRRLMSLYLDARRRRQAIAASAGGRWSNGPPSASARAGGQVRIAPNTRR
jgi:transcriptional regulator with XRE-family HTH domain